MAQTKVKPELLTGGFNTITALTPAATVNVDYNSAQIFTLTPTSNTTLNITDAQKRNNITIGSAIHTEGVLKFVKTFHINLENT